MLPLDRLCVAASLCRVKQAGASSACACTHVSHASHLCRHAKEEAEKKEREERQKRQEELRQKRKVALPQTENVSPPLPDWDADAVANSHLCLHVHACCQT